MKFQNEVEAMPNMEKDNSITLKNEIDRLKKEIEIREADYAVMSSEKARKEDTKATYTRYMRQAEGNNRIWTAISAALFIIFAAVLCDAVVQSISGNIEPAMWVVAAIICAVCIFAISVIIVRDVTKRNIEAKMRLSSHIHRYDMQVRHLQIEIDELKAKLAELEKSTDN